jgi:hypothetical protein
MVTPAYPYPNFAPIVNQALPACAACLDTLQTVPRCVRSRAVKKNPVRKCLGCGHLQRGRPPTPALRQPAARTTVQHTIV